MSRAVTLFVWLVVLWQAALGLQAIVTGAASVSLEQRRSVLLASDEVRIARSLGEAAPLWKALEHALAEAPSGPQVVYLLASEGLPTDLGELGEWQQRLSAPLAALLQPTVLRLLPADRDLGPLIGDEALYLVEVGPHHALPFFGVLEELVVGADFRIYRLPAGGLR